MVVQIAIRGQEMFWRGGLPKLASDSVNQVVFEFIVLSDWDGFDLVAQFSQNGKTFNKVVTNGKAKMPVEIGAGRLEISVFGTSGTESRNTVVALETVVRQSGFKSDGQTPIPPTPDLYDQLLQRIDAASGEASESAKAAAKSAEAAAGSAKAAAGSAEEAERLVTGAVTAISIERDEAVRAVNTAGGNAVQAVNTTGNSAVQNLEQKKTEAVQAIEDAQAAGVKAVNDAGNAKVEDIEQINALLPKPTEADTGKVPVAQPDGRYQLGDAGNKIDDKVIAEDTTWSSKETASRIYQMREVSGAIVCIDDALPKFPMKVTSESEVTRCGKNLLDLSNAYANGFNITGIKNFLIPGVQYTFSNIKAGGINFGVYVSSNANAPWAEEKRIARYVDEGYAITFVAPDDVQKYPNLALAGGKTGIVDVFPDVEFQIEVGAEATNYEPYTGETFPAGEPIMPLDGVNTIFAASGDVTVEYASKVKAPIDDTQVSPLNTWSAQKLVDTLCPPFSVTEDVVQFASIESYPLSVQSTIVATQSGEGDPSPENVRPIVPVEQVGAWVGGKNLCPYGSPTFTGYYQASFGFFIPAGTYVFSALVTADDADYDNNLVYFFNTKTGKGVVSKTITRNVRRTFSVSVPDKFDAIYLYASVGASQSVGKTATFADIQLELGTSATAYEPYRGQLYTAQLDEPCYGGTVDLTGGKFSKTFGVTVVDGTTVKFTTNAEKMFYNLPYNSSPNVGQDATDNILSSHFPYIIWSKNGRFDFIFSTAERMAPYFSNVDELNAYCQQQYAAGTPVTIVYPFEVEEVADITPLSIHAPASPATAYSTAGEITVSGRSDPTALIKQMQEQIAVLQSATIEG